MRLPIALAFAIAAAGFTVQEAEQTLNGEWVGRLFPVGLQINVASGSATLTEGGKNHGAVQG